MLEHGLSHQVLPQENKLRKLVTFMKDYGAERMNKDWIIRYLKWMDEAMKHVPISDSIRRLMTVQNVERKRINLLSIGECALAAFSDLRALISITRWRFQWTSGSLYNRRDTITACIRSQIK